jgi:hypothetical protein
LRTSVFFQELAPERRLYLIRRPILSPSCNLAISAVVYALRERATGSGRDAVGKSIFHGGEDVVSLVKAAEGVVAKQQTGGNFQRIVDAGRSIGIDRATGQPTSIYTVITDKAGHLVTTFPGLPGR